MISLEDYWMGRDKKYPPSPETIFNATILIDKINELEKIYGEKLKLTSGYRPAAINAITSGAAKDSAHLTGEAVDFSDPHGELGEWCLDNIKILVSLELYMEAPKSAWDHVHLQIRKPASGARVFNA